MATVVEWNSGALPATGGVDEPIVDGDEIVIPGPGQGYAMFTPSPLPEEFALRFYVRTPEAWASSATNIFRSISTSGITSICALAGTGAPGQVRFSGQGGNTSTTSSSNNLLSLGSLYRVEMLVNGPEDTFRGRVYDDGNSLLWDTGDVAGECSGEVIRVELGKTASNDLGEFRLSHIRVDDTLDWIGPWGDLPPQPSYTTHVWDGSSLVPVTLDGLWDGEELVSVTL